MLAISSPNATDDLSSDGRLSRLATTLVGLPVIDVIGEYVCHAVTIARPDLRIDSQATYAPIALRGYKQSHHAGVIGVQST